MAEMDGRECMSVVETDHSFRDPLHRVFRYRADTVLVHQPPQFVFTDPFLDGFDDFVIGTDQFEQTDPIVITGPTTSRATDGKIDLYRDG